MFDRRVWRKFDPPRPVVLDPYRGLPIARASLGATELPLWLVVAGLRLDAPLAAEQLAWLRLADGQWMASIRVRLSSRNGDNVVAIAMLVPAAAITPAYE